ncbi:MAG: hypothetical protein NTX05_00080 [Fusobacteria bacterium]|nr:hypothetical protein [Fusobacteriota bacterium]
MKKIIILISSLSIISSLCLADTISNPWNFQINIGQNTSAGNIKLSNGSESLSRPSTTTPLFLGFNSFYKFSNSQWAGLGFNIEDLHNVQEMSGYPNYYTVMGNLPIYAIYRLNLLNNSIFLPYFEGKLGLDFAHAPNFGCTYNPGLFWSAGIGTTFKNTQLWFVNLSNINFELNIEDGNVYATNNNQQGTKINYMRYGVSMGYNFNI